jgi:transposase
MEKIRNKLKQVGLDELEYQRYFHQNQAEYIRTKLRCVRMYYAGNSFGQICARLGLHHQSARKYVNTYLAGGLEQLCQPTVRRQPCLLSQEQAAAFKQVLLSTRPEEVGLEGNLWTGQLMCQYLSQSYGVVYKSGIYDLLERLNLSHQKAHADYGNADPNQRMAFLTDLKDTLLAADEKTAVVKFDEFSVCERPTSYYGWAEKNTRPRVVTNEKNASAPTDC